MWPRQHHRKTTDEVFDFALNSFRPYSFNQLLVRVYSVHTYFGLLSPAPNRPRRPYRTGPRGSKGTGTSRMSEEIGAITLSNRLSDPRRIPASYWGLGATEASIPTNLPRESFAPITNNNLIVGETVKTIQIHRSKVDLTDRHGKGRVCHRMQRRALLCTPFSMSWPWVLILTNLVADLRRNFTMPSSQGDLAFID